MSKIVRLVFALLLIAPPVHAGIGDPCSCQLPVSIDVTDDLRRRMAAMLQRSATFRQQCQRLAVPGLHIQIRVDVQLIDRQYSARSVIQRSDTGSLIAWVAITPIGDPTQWLAHELEHIIEQLDGVRIPQLAGAGARDAWRTGDDMFETERARRIGRLVLHEVLESNRTLAHAARAIETGGRGD